MIIKAILYCVIFVIQLSQAASFSYVSTDWTDTCASGTSQSPINLEVSTGTCDNSMVLDIQFVKTPLTVSIERLDYTVHSLAAISSLYATDINGDLYGYTATEFLFHAPSEHTKEGTRYDMEMQIVHTIKPEFASSVKTTAIVSIFFQQSDLAQPFLTAYDFTLVSTATSNTTTTTTTTTTNTTNTTNTTSTNTAKSISINFNDLLGSQLDTNPVYYTYQGSLTIPTCDEIVNWYVLDSVLPISATQLSTFNAFYKGNSSFAGGNGNNRGIRALNDRTIKKGGVACEEQFVYFFSFFILYIFINYFIFKLL